MYISFYSFSCSGLKILESAQNVAKGINEAIPAMKMVLKLHFLFTPTNRTKIQYAKNKKPCVYPIILLGKKMSNAYFKGIVIAKAI